MTDIMLIPGAWSTGHSFNYLISLFSKHPNVEKIYTFDYDASLQRVPEIIDKANNFIAKLDNPTILVGHSMGGIIAANVVNNHKHLTSLMTISSPLSGIKYNVLMNFYLSHRFPILEDVSEGSDFIEKIHQLQYKKPVTMLVSTMGFNPVIFEQNDGVITVASQINWKPKNARMQILPTSHHEILQRSETMVELGRLLEE